MRSAMNAVACREWNCALRAPTARSARIRDIRTENAVTVNNKGGAGVLLPDHRLRPDGSFIRAQSVIRADGFSSAQHRRSVHRGDT
jgi:hypothetical protein